MTALIAGMMTGVVRGEDSNPFAAAWNTPFGIPPFEQIETQHYEPAFAAAITAQQREIAAIAASTEAPTFANTIEALDASGLALAKVRYVFLALNSALTDPEMQGVARTMAPLLSQHQDEILLNAELFRRVDAIYAQRDDLDLADEQRMLLKKTYRRFVRGGANLAADSKDKLKAINEELSMLSLEFGENVLKETNRFELLVTDEADLAGLPSGAVAAAAEAATGAGHSQGWLFTLHKPSLIPFLQYAEKRELRRQMYTAYIQRGNHGDELDNKGNLTRLAVLRLERARLLGYLTHAHYVLEENMAQQPDRVYDLLEQLWRPGLDRAKAEAAEFQTMIDAEGGDFVLAPWDWWYYAEKVKKARYDLDEEMLRPYFELERVRAGMFEVATRLFGLTFHELADVPRYHEDVTVFEVKDGDGSHLAVLFLDYFPRASKRGGAWMDAFRKQAVHAGQPVTPLIFNVGNFTKPTADLPSLLSVDEVGTMFHEFGHALHGMLSDCSYRTLSGTSVARDFVELPSQIMENWAFEPEVLARYARHYSSDELIPDELVRKIHDARHFNQGFVTTEYVAASFLDMDWHTLTDVTEPESEQFEARSLARIGLIPEIASRYRSPYFRHVFAGGYSAGYYSYIWAAVLDADAFAAFKEAGDIFDPQVAQSFRKNILSRGGSAEPMDLYKRFRGHEPGIAPLLERRGLN